MALRIYNSLTREKTDFVPVEQGQARLYVCGVTVYSDSHIGHARSAIVFDVISRYLRTSGFDVKYVRNFTDIDDKIINRANSRETRLEGDSRDVHRLLPRGHGRPRRAAAHLRA